ncbi:MAG: hypothetical protein H0V06_04920 [Gemmatimonadetes bacterium]|nr:hypothetical protein [Gemmatimonadota bacterium]
MQEEPLLDAMLRETIPEVKLALGEHIDRDNERAIPDRYAKLLPDTTLVVTLRADAADALAPVATEVARELSDSCMRHGSLYDRAYYVRLARTESDGAPLFGISAEAGRSAVEVAPVPAPAPPPRVEPRMDPDATRVEQVAPRSGWQPGRFVLVVEDDEGNETEAFPLTEPLSTVGRQSDDPALRADVSIADVPHVSRRQLAVAWDPRAGEPSFRVYNLGLNPIHLGDRTIPGANQKRGPLRVEDVPGMHTERWTPGDTLRIGSGGPTLRLRDAGESASPAEDPDATRFG